MPAPERSGFDPVRSVRSLLAHRFLLRLALSGSIVFAWMFVFQYFYLVEGDLQRSLARAALLYALSQTITCIGTPYAARLLRGGVRRTVICATLLAAVALVVLGAAFEGLWGSANTSLALVAFAVALGSYRALYWVPYEIEAASQISRPRPSVTAETLVALSPLAGGLFIAGVGSAPLWLLYIAAAFILASIVPLTFVRDVHEHFSWGYRQTFSELLAPAHRALLAQGFLEGISGAALLFFWPFAIFLITGWSYGVLGIILSLTLLVALFARTFVRRTLRRFNTHRSALMTGVLAISPWLLRLVVATPLGVILVDSYFYTTAPQRFGVDPFVFEQSADGGSLLDEYTTLKEISLTLGRAALAIAGALVALLTSVPLALVAVFVIAAAASTIMAFRNS